MALPAATPILDMRSCVAANCARVWNVVASVFRGRIVALVVMSAVAISTVLLKSEVMADNRVEVTFESEPAGFEVQWRSSTDSGLPLTLGVTPCKVMVPAGWQVFRFYKPGWPVLKNETAVRPGDENKISFRRPYGMAVVDAKPGAATIMVDAKKVGVTPMKIPLPAGVHRLTLKYEGWEDMSETVIIRNNQDSTSNVLFPHSEASFIAEMPDSEIFLDGESIGKSPVKKLIKSGERTVKIVPSTPGLPPIFERVTIPNEPKSKFIFKIPNGALKLTGFPNGADVIDKATGENLGSLPFKLDCIKPGRRTLEITRRGYWTKELTLDIQDGGKVQAHVELQRSAANAGENFFLKNGLEFVYVWRNTWVSKQPVDDAVLAEIQADQQSGNIPAFYNFGPLSNAEWKSLAPPGQQEVLLRAGQAFMANIMYFSRTTQTGKEIRANGLIFYPGQFVEKVLPTGKETEGLDKADAAFGISADEKKLVYFESGASNRSTDLPPIKLRIKMSNVK
ncbi:MAG: PEGA domain-containing protein [Candidatus Methylacidiphilales bacterium]|nr:PEGA domain-containing protein [Candidatus Methylacidiphilales bacterium]